MARKSSKYDSEDQNRELNNNAKPYVFINVTLTPRSASNVMSCNRF